MYILIAILLFGLLILVHEFGHYLTARIFKVTINEFSIGMGPKLISKKSKKTGIAYSLRLLPIGGFVSMAGEDEESDDENAFSKKPVWQRIIISVAGSLSNILIGFLVMFILVSTMPRIPSTVINDFAENSVSDSYGLMPGDRITEVAGHKVHIANEMVYFISRYGAEPVDVKVVRDGKELVLENVKFPTYSSGGMVFGDYDFYIRAADKNIGTVIKNGFHQATLTIRTVFDSLFDLITGKYGVKDLSGPVGVTNVISSAAKTGNAYQVFYIFVLLAMNLGIMNLIPFPALDGGRVLMLIIELIIRRPVNKKAEGYINLIGMAILLLFMAFITFKDITQLIRK